MGVVLCVSLLLGSLLCLSPVLLPSDCSAREEKLPLMLLLRARAIDPDDSLAGRTNQNGPYNIKCMGRFDGGSPQLSVCVLTGGALV